MSADPWIVYRLRRIEFQNGAVLGFGRARMGYDDANGDRIRIDHIDAPSAEIDRALSAIVDSRGYLPELKTIFYDMEVEGHAPIRFYHPMKRGTGVRLLPPRARSSMLYFGQEDGDSMFTKEWTLRDVSEGEIDSDKRVWQFHGYKHED